MPTLEGGGGDKGHVPQVSNTLGLRSCKPAPKRVTTSPANPRGLIYIRPPRISPPPTDPGVSPGARAQSWLAAEAASLLPFSAPKEREGLRGDKRSETGGPESSVREAGALSSREGFPGRSGEPAPKAERRGLAGHRYWPQPASLAQRAGPAGRRGSGGCCFAPTTFGRRANVTRRPEWVGGHRAGTRIPTASRRPQALATPHPMPARGAPLGPRRLPAPTPRPFRSQGGSGPSAPGRPRGRPRGPAGARS